MITVLPYSKKSHLGEIYQSMELKMALLRRKEANVFEQVTPFVKCRDFLCDVHSATLAKRNFEIYGMRWKGSKDPVDWDALRLVLRFPNAGIKDVFMSNLMDILHQIEDSNGYSQTLFVDLDNGDWVSIGDKKWLDNAMKFSLYTLLLRVMCYKLDLKRWVEQFCEMDTTDSRYLKSINRDTLNRVLTDLSLLDTEEWCGLPWDEWTTGNIHHNSGFISVFGKHTEINTAVVKQNLHYLQMKARGLKMYV